MSFTRRQRIATSADEELRLLGTRRVADLLGISTRRVHQLVEAGVLHPVRLVPLGDLRFRVEDIKRLIAGEAR